MFKPTHLTDEAANILAGANQERVYFIQSKRWIAYPKAVHILDHLNKMLRHPRTTRMPSLVVYDSGMGKSMLIDKFKADCAAASETDTAPNRNKVLVVEMSGRPTERRLYSQILAAVDAPHSPRASIVDVERGALNILRNIGVQILVIDEIHNILAGSWREQRIVLNTLRFLSNELKVSLVCFGILEARDAINGDVQLARRLDAVTLPRWTADKEFEQLVLALVRNLPCGRHANTAPMQIAHAGGDCRHLGLHQCDLFRASIEAEFLVMSEHGQTYRRRHEGAVLRFFQHIARFFVRVGRGKLGGLLALRTF